MTSAAFVGWSIWEAPRDISRSPAVDAYLQLPAAVFELPEVSPVTREYARDRIDVLAGDFFSDPLPEADLYALGQVLHDWPEDKIRLLLRKIHDTLPAGGALLIAERLLYDDKTGPRSALMLVPGAGNERSASIRRYCRLKVTWQAGRLARRKTTSHPSFRLCRAPRRVALARNP